MMQDTKMKIVLCAKIKSNDKRTIIVGDVHGCYDQLCEVLSQVNFDANKDRIIFLGDYFDRGSQSFEVFEFIKGLKEKMQDDCIVLIGNHDHALIYSGKDDLQRQTFMYYGKETRASFKQNNLSMFDVIDWLKKNAVYYVEAPNFYCVHGGFYNQLKYDNPEEMIWNREALERGDELDKVVFVGHTPMNEPVFALRGETTALTYLERYDVPKSGVIGLDTGCVFGDNLTVAIVCGDEFMVAGAGRKEECIS